MPDCDCVITIRSRLAQNRLEGSRPGVGQARPPVVFHGATPSRRVGWLRRSRTRAPDPRTDATKWNALRPRTAAAGRLARSPPNQPTSAGVEFGLDTACYAPGLLPRPTAAADTADTASPTPAAAPSKPSCGHWARAPAACSSLENPSTEDDVVARTSRRENQRPRSSTTPGGSSRPGLCRGRFLRQYPAMPHDP
jgi:hypothetical protein